MAEAAPLLTEAVPFIAHPQIRNRGTVGGTLAHADPAAEMPAVAIALGARLRLVSSQGERWVPASDFFSGLFSTVLEPGEILTEIEIPGTGAGQGSAFLEVARRHGDYALAGVAVTVTVDAGRCRKVNLVALGVGDRPTISWAIDEILVGENPTPDRLDAAVDALRQEIAPTGDIHASAAFKRHLSGVMARRALGLAFERAEDRGSG